MEKPLDEISLAGQAAALGYQARIDGRPRDALGQSSELRGAWLEGWDRADEEQKSENREPTGLAGRMADPPGGPRLIGNFPD